MVKSIVLCGMRLLIHAQTCWTLSVVCLPMSWYLRFLWLSTIFFNLLNKMTFSETTQGPFALMFPQEHSLVRYHLNEFRIWKEFSPWAWQCYLSAASDENLHYLFPATWHVALENIFHKDALKRIKLLGRPFHLLWQTSTLEMATI